MNKFPSSSYKIRFSDCDMFGHLNNARYIDYLLNAREDHLSDNYQLGLQAFYQQGIGWLVGSHQISYLRPAAYNEKVMVKSSLINASNESLLVEMLMMDEKEQQIKAMMWTRFVPVNIKTGKRENHSIAFMDFARSIETNEVDIAAGYDQRLRTIVEKIRAV